MSSIDMYDAGFTLRACIYAQVQDEPLTRTSHLH